jgi:hypothetical protein
VRFQRPLPASQSFCVLSVRCGSACIPVQFVRKLCGNTLGMLVSLSSAPTRVPSFGCAGTFFNSSVCLPCPPGRFMNLFGAGSCSACPAGRFGGSEGLSVSVCTGLCDAGYACGEGSVVPNVTACPAGQYSNAGAGVCTPCPAGRFGNKTAQGTLAVGCDGLCSAGYSCLAGATTSIGDLCAAGRFSTPGASVCSNCSAGYVCSPGSTEANPAVGICPAGQFSLAGAIMCSNCSAGYFCGVAGATSATTSPCVYRACRPGAVSPPPAHLPLHLGAVCAVCSALVCAIVMCAFAA